MTLQAWQDRVVREKEDLDSKIGALMLFRRGSNWAALDDENKILLSAQLVAMRDYSAILGKRIKLFR